jgi:hypothetical protein
MQSLIDKSQYCNRSLAEIELFASNNERDPRKPPKAEDKKKSED